MNLMEEWPKSFFEMVEAVTVEVEKFFRDITEDIEALAEVSEQIANGVHNTLTVEFEQFFNELVEPVIEVYLEMEEVSFESEWPMTDSVEPSPERYPACIGCRHYHGQAYGGNLLVCGMHPYGWDSGNCPDWQGYTNRSPF